MYIPDHTYFANDKHGSMIRIPIAFLLAVVAGWIVFHELREKRAKATQEEAAS